MCAFLFLVREPGMDQVGGSPSTGKASSCSGGLSEAAAMFGVALRLVPRLTIGRWNLGRLAIVCQCPATFSVLG
jgi:hypothetical protein